ncbi:hypothetical protein DRW03_01175 [Corallococcus sp. H22C18031201]|nr:hypothetical protein DRW03_01175 [Corallococcus sp. H22C18031201]
MSVSTRAVLVVHPSAERRAQLREILAEYEVIEATNRLDASKFLVRTPPALVLTTPELFPRLLKDLERSAPRAVRVVLCPRRTVQVQQELVDLAAAGHMFFTLEEEPLDALRKALHELMQVRGSGRRDPAEPFMAHFEAGGVRYQAEVADVGTGGVGLHLMGGVHVERLTPGTRLEGLVLTRRDGTPVLNAVGATVRVLRAMNGAGGHHLGVSMERPPRAEEGSLSAVLQDRVAIHGLLRRAVRRGAAFSLRSHEGNRLVDFGHARFAMESTRLLLSEQRHTAELFNPGDMVQLCFDLGGMSHVGTTAVLSQDGAVLSVAIPRSLTEYHRRNSLRFRSTPDRPFAISFVAPLTGEEVYRPLLDLHVGGVAFSFDAGHEVYPPGLRLDALTLHLPGGSTARCRGHVVDTGPLAHSDETRTMERPRRCGVRFDELDDVAHRAIMEAFIHARCPFIHDGSMLPFPAIWDMFRAARVRFPDYPLEGGPALTTLEDSHRMLGDGRHGLSKTLVFERDGDLRGHSSGLRIYSRTWMSQHLVVRPGYHRQESISQDLVSLAVDYAESLGDIDYLRGLWRGHNRWSARIFGGIAARMQRPGLSSLHAYTPCRIPIQRALAMDPGAWRVRPAAEEDVAWLEAYLREHQDIVRLRSTDLLGDEMRLTTLSRRYAEQGLERGREFAVVDGPSGPLGMVVMESMTPGLFWAEWFNAFWMVIPDPASPHANEVRRALVAHASRRMAERGRPVAECLAEDGDLSLLATLGFQNLGRVFEWSIHRTLAREWNNQLVSVFERLSRPQEDEATLEGHETAA